MSTRSQKLFEQVDGLIKSGHTSEAKQALKRYRDAKIPPAELRRFASLARRLGMTSTGIRMLLPLIHPSGRVQLEPTSEDRLEYGACLVRLGAISEGRSLLNTLDAGKLPWVSFVKALACFYVWDYASAVPLLEAYLKTPDLADYQRATAKANLAAALVDTRDPRAEEFLRDLLPELRRKKFELLLLHSLMVEGERCVQSDQNAAAVVALEEARRIASAKSPRELLIVDKWAAVVDLKRKGKSALSGLLEVRNRALSLREWETVRNCDFHRATVLKDKALFERVYFGTPFPSLRETLFRSFGEGAVVPSTYDLVSEDHSPILESVDLGEVENGRIRGLSLKPGNTVHRLLGILLSDFYKPFRTVPLHEQLFPGEFYNPDSSPQRVQKTIRRLRLSFTDRLFGIEHVGHGYRLVLRRGISMRIHSDVAPKSREEAWIRALLETFRESPPFSIQEACTATGIKIWNCRKILKAARTRGLLVQVGKGPAIRYQIVDIASRRAAS